MYYKEKVVDGILMCQTIPNGAWYPVTNSLRAEAIKLLDSMSEDNRLEVLRFFCPNCGNLTCTCTAE